jgi:hypothetical protein
VGRPEMTSGITNVFAPVSAVYHYQMKVHIFSYKNKGELQPTFYVTLYGTNADSQILPLEV